MAFSGLSSSTPRGRRLGQTHRHRWVSVFWVLSSLEPHDPSVNCLEADRPSYHYYKSPHGKVHADPCLRPTGPSCVSSPVLYSSSSLRFCGVLRSPQEFRLLLLPQPRASLISIRIFCLWIQEATASRSFIVEALNFIQIWHALVLRNKWLFPIIRHKNLQTTRIVFLQSEASILKLQDIYIASAMMTCASNF